MFAMKDCEKPCVGMVKAGMRSSTMQIAMYKTQVKLKLTLSERAEL
jgi:hypothetical protein